MASGKKNYFRHSIHAFEDEKIQSAIDKLGYEGYAYYFILLELLCKQCENEYKNPIKIHQQSLRNVWRKHTKSCKKVVEKLQESGLFVATFKESFIEFDIPKLAKYMGKYESKKHPNSPNKRKENKIKEKESKLLEHTSYRPDDLIQLWNEIMPSDIFTPITSVFSNNMLDNFSIITHNIKDLDQWRNILIMCKDSEFMCGENNNNWKVSLDWLLDWNNTVKVLNGNYTKKKKNLFKWDD